LSNFSPCKLRTEDGIFKSPEHNYQYKLLEHHGKHNEKEKCRKAKNAAIAKAIAKEACPIHNDAWTEMEEKVMEHICNRKFEQCSEFRTYLMNTGNKRLLHNMETDPKWGIGKDARGQNLLGVILEKIRKKGHDMPTPQEAQPKSLPANHSQRNILVIGDSMLSNIKEHLESVCGDLSVTVKCVGGIGVADLN
jgi:ribA/ribD-fused uncharacterized protein